MEKLRIAVIGAGYMGKFHAEKFAASADAELVAVVDADPARAITIATALGCAHESGYHALLARADARIEAVCVAVPTEKHHAVVRDCLEAGVHVLVEKPLSRTLEEADSLLELARTKGLVLQVGHLQRFNPVFQALVAQGGRPLFIDIERLAPFKTRGTDVDVVLDLMIHDLDLVLALAKAPIEQVSASGFRVLTDAIDIANARIEFTDGCIASVSASRVSQAQVRKLRVFRHDSYVSADLQEQRLRHVRKGPEGGTAGDTAGIVESEQAFERADELRAQAEAFVQAVRGRGVPLVTGEQGRQALALALQVGRLVEERLARHGT
ncbi:MAG: Gfo/Idh/MocA family oxidoreductase [Betaproteobacteria bacterium]|nr:Gfo/Idh/MocA family oxidoreductase [Betaproteobacteria bacterium]